MNEVRDSLVWVYASDAFGVCCDFCLFLAPHTVWRLGKLSAVDSRVFFLFLFTPFSATSAQLPGSTHAHTLDFQGKNRSNLDSFPGGKYPDRVGNEQWCTGLGLKMLLRIGDWSKLWTQPVREDTRGHLTRLKTNPDWFSLWAEGCTDGVFFLCLFRDTDVKDEQLE